MQTKKTKNRYEMPKIELITIAFEQSIAAGSATARPEDSNSHIKDSWSRDQDDSRTIDW